ncbi:calcium-activated chloride channel regulator 1 [Anolis carolinensis]|uniref:VWFA domain-containing protein n=1 Tax=Anolis carolinensis TaxID=28377 RepID=L7MZH4_ANOCA|nr:PREDICTED: epithelial chloride channel protein [Anolis carolinensis]|eukprot:XP_003220166.1 PREDICTED: epithelial chloride channel protein [Anolis carolinensis]
MLLNQWHLVTAVLLLHGVKGTQVKLSDGGYEEIVLAINPGVSEDTKIIDNIKEMVEEASSYLFSATKQRFYLKTIKVVIPLTWTPKPEYQRVTKESYEKADIIVADPFVKYGDEPYTLQYGGCGEKGRYIHFTPNFLTNDSFLSVYGSRGRVFVHEWAHLRWGLFDEYNNDAPFYSVGKNEAEATRCSSDITGKYIFRNDKGQIRTCNTERRSQLFEAGCQFIPDKTQTTPVSIMYMQNLSSVTQFCDESSHNIKAPNMQNKMCDYRSTWEVIMDSADFVNSSPRSAPPPHPTLSLLQTRDRVVCLVLDVSGSMRDFNRIHRLKQAAELFLLQIIETGSWAGIVVFNSKASTKAFLQQITSDSVRQTLSDHLPTVADGGTSICSGIREGFQVFLQKYSSTEGCEIVLLTDGEDSSVSSCFAEVERSGSTIHTIALGPSAAKELEMLANMTGGLTFSATDSLDSNGLIDAFSGISSGSGDISQQSIQLESKGQYLTPYQRMNGIVLIDKTVGNDTFFVVTWSVSTNPPVITLRDPKGKTYTETDFVIDKTNIRTARLKIPGTAEAGGWVYRILNTHTTAQGLSITVTTRAASVTVPPVVVKSYLNTESNNYPSPVIIYAEVSQGFLPVIGANVIATIESAAGKSVQLQLLDDGSGPDILKHDGIYSKYFTSFKYNGRYNIKVHVQGKDETTRRARRQSQSLYITGYVENGEIKLNPPRPHPREDEIQANVGNFSRMASGGSFVMTGVPPGNPPDVFPPCKITDLEVELSKNKEFLLSWTAPGNDYDTGKAEIYEIRMSENPLELRDATFHNATSLNTSGLIPELAGIKQSFMYKLENLQRENATSIYFAIRATDENDNVGEASNIARAVLFPDYTNPNSSSDNLMSPCIVKAILLQFLILKTIILAP